MSSETASKDNDIASMLDSIEEAIGADMSWSDVPPPDASEGGEVEVIQVIELDAAPAPVLTMNAPAAEEPLPEPLLSAPEPAPFQGISSELRTYPDPTPRPAGVGGFVRGSTRDVMGLFKWGGA
jgi:hypothetical protein